MADISALDNVADAFQAEMNPNSRRASDVTVRNEGPVERMFDNLEANFEDDGEDGGDDTTIQSKIELKTNRQPKSDPKTPNVEEDPDGDPDGEVEGDGEEGDEPDVEDEPVEEGEDEEPEVKAFYDTKVEVTIDGKVEDVSVREALNGYIRTQTFHRRMNQVNEAATVVSEEARKVAANRDRYTAMNAEIEGTLKELMPAEPDWDKMFAEDPASAHKLKKQYDDYKGKLDTLKGNRERAMQEIWDENARTTETFAKNEIARFIENNKIETPEDLTKEISSMRKTGLAAGFTEQEIAAVYDSRMLTVLRKASKYDRMMAAKPKAAIPDKGKTLVPGGGKSASSSTRNGYGQAARNLARTGSIDDAAVFFRKFTR